MTPGSLLLGAALILLVGLFLARPILLSTRDQRWRRTARLDLLNQKEATLAQIEMLDFDFETGKMPEQQYKKQRRQMVAQAADILKALDNYADIAEPVQNGNADAEIEAAVAAFRKSTNHQKPMPAQAAPIPQQAPPPRPVTTNGLARFCSQCGQPVDGEDKFCAFCGHQVQPV